MLRTAVIATLLLAASAAQAAECTLTNARYKQPDAPWWLTFKRVPQFAAANQTAAFYLELPNSGVTIEGGVHVPNGFGAPLWSISGPCGPDHTEICTFLGEYARPAIYGAYDDGIAFLRTEPSEAPQQLLLPGLAAALWYSHYRNGEWFEDVSPGDAFTLVGCD